MAPIQKIALSVSATSYRYGNEHSQAPTQKVNGEALTNLVNTPEDIVKQITQLKEQDIHPAMVHVHPLSTDFKPIPGWPVCDASGKVVQKGWYQDFSAKMRELDPDIYITGASAMLHLETELQETKQIIQPLIEEAGSLALKGIVKPALITKIARALKLPEEQISDCFKGVKYAYENRKVIRQISAPQTRFEKIIDCFKGVQYVHANRNPSPHVAASQETTRNNPKAPLSLEEVSVLVSEILVRGQALWGGMDGLPIISVHSLQAHNRYSKSSEKIIALEGAFDEKNLQSMGNYKHDIYLSPVLAHLCYEKGIVPEVEIQHPSQIPLVREYQKAGFLRKPLNCGFVIGMAITNSPENVAKKKGGKDYAGKVMEAVMKDLSPNSIRMVVLDRINVPGELEKSWDLAFKLKEKYPNIIHAVDMGCEYTTRFGDKTNCSNVELVSLAAQDIQVRLSQQATNNIDMQDCFMEPKAYKAQFEPKQSLTRQSRH